MIVIYNEWIIGMLKNHVFCLPLFSNKAAHNISSSICVFYYIFCLYFGRAIISKRTEAVISSDFYGQLQKKEEKTRTYQLTSIIYITVKEMTLHFLIILGFKRPSGHGQKTTWKRVRKMNE